MPLDKHHRLTASSKLMLRVYPPFSTLIGLAYLLGSSQRFQSTSFDTARRLMPIRVWGIVFIVVGLCLFVAWLSADVRVMLICLILAATFYTFWASIFGLSLLDYDHGLSHLRFDPKASFSAPVLWTFVTLAHVASMRSLTYDSGSTV